MGLKKLFSPSLRGGSYSPVTEPLTNENEAPAPHSPAPVPVLELNEKIEEFTESFLKKAQLEFKKKLAMDQEDGTKPAFCGTAEKRRRKREALAVLYRHLDREVMLQKRKGQTIPTIELTDSEKFDRFFIQLAIEIYSIYQHQFEKLALKSQEKEDSNSMSLEKVAELTARLCFSKCSCRKMENWSKDEILFKSLTHFDPSLPRLHKKETHKKETKEVKEVKVKKDEDETQKNSNEAAGDQEKTDTKDEEKVKETKGKKETKEVKCHHKKRENEGNLKFFTETIPAFYCNSSSSLLVDSKNLKKLLKGKPDGEKIAMRLRKPFKMEWDQMHRGRECVLKAIDHLVDGTEEDMKKFTWQEKSPVVTRIYSKIQLTQPKLSEEEDMEIRKQVKEAFIQLDQDMDKTKDVIRQLEENLG